MNEYSISEKGWVVIPAELRKKYGLKSGTKVYIIDYGGVLSIVPAMENPVEQAAGMLRTDKKLTQQLLEDRRDED